MACSIHQKVGGLQVSVQDTALMGIAGLGRLGRSVGIRNFPTDRFLGTRYGHHCVAVASALKEIRATVNQRAWSDPVVVTNSPVLAFGLGIEQGGGGRRLFGCT